MKKYIILSMMLFGALGLTYGQDDSGGGDAPASYAPAAGDISGAILFGRGNFLNSGLSVPSAPGTSSGWTVQGTAPYANNIDENDNDVSNIVGVEGRYFLMDNIAIKLSGGAIIRNTPARENIQSPIGQNSGGNNQAWIPNYASVHADNLVDMNINLGGEYHFGSKYDRLFPYGGLTIPFYYARRSMYDPTVTSNDDGDVTIYDIGTRHVEIVGFGAQLVGGVDYYLMEGLYFGFEVKPVSYIYAYSRKNPGPGLENLEADTHTFSFFAQTFFKVGFRF